MRGPAPAESRVSFRMSGVMKKRKQIGSWLSAGSRLVYSFTSVLIYPKTNNPLKRFKEGVMIRLYQVHNHGNNFSEQSIPTHNF